jgi:hypothetical protein
MSEYGINPFNKDEWIGQFAAYIKTANVGLISWFNLDKESGWQVFGGEYGAEEENTVKYYPAYKTLVSDDSFIAADTNNIRIITNSQFEGAFTGEGEVEKFVRRCEAQYAITAKWTGGYVAKMTLTANFMLSDNWEVQWQFPETESVSYGWRADMAQQANEVSATAPSWWYWMPADSMPDFGFVAAGEGSAPEAVTLSGVDCSIAE